MSPDRDDAIRRSFLAEELEQTADWRIRKVGDNPQDRQSAEAALLLQRLADEVRSSMDSPLYRELMALCAWLEEGDGAEEFADLAHTYRTEIGFEATPASSAEYLRQLLLLAKKSLES